MGITQVRKWGKNLVGKIQEIPAILKEVRRERRLIFQILYLFWEKEVLRRSPWKETGLFSGYRILIEKHKRKREEGYREVRQTVEENRNFDKETKEKILKEFTPELYQEALSYEDAYYILSQIFLEWYPDKVILEIQLRPVNYDLAVLLAYRIDQIIRENSGEEKKDPLELIEELIGILRKAPWETLETLKKFSFDNPDIPEEIRIRAFHTLTRRELILSIHSSYISQVVLAQYKKLDKFRETATLEIVKREIDLIPFKPYFSTLSPVPRDLLDFPWVSYTKRPGKNPFVFYEDEKIRVEIGSIYGALRPFDRDRIIDLILPSYQEINGQVAFRFLIPDYLKRIGKGTYWAYGTRVRKSLKKLITTTGVISYKDPQDSKKEIAIVPFHLFKPVPLPGEGEKNREIVMIADEPFASWIKAKHYKLIDYKTYMSIESDIGRGIYLYLEPRLGKQKRIYRENFRRFIRKIGLSTKDITRTIERIEKALRELGGKSDIYYWREGNNIYFNRKSWESLLERRRELPEKIKPLFPPGSIKSPRDLEKPGETQDQARSFNLLKTFGISNGKALALLDKYKAKEIQACLEGIDLEKFKGKSRKLLKWIEENYQESGKPGE